MNDLKVEYDDEGDVLYVRLQFANVHRSKAVDDLRLIDYSDDGAIVGVEFIGASGGIDLRDMPFAHKVEQLIGEAGLGFPVFA
jgi:uncharacterized protein YuzE